MLVPSRLPFLRSQHFWPWTCCSSWSNQTAVAWISCPLKTCCTNSFQKKPGNESTRLENVKINVVVKHVGDFEFFIKNIHWTRVKFILLKYLNNEWMRLSFRYRWPNPLGRSSRYLVKCRPRATIQSLQFNAIGSMCYFWKRPLAFDSCRSRWIPPIRLLRGVADPFLGSKWYC